MLTEGYVPDADAVHVAQSHLLARFLRAAGLEVLEHRTLPHRPDPTGPRALVRPISATTARARLCDALLVAPDDPPPFAALAGLLRPARGVHLAIGDLLQSLEQLARLLPRWSVE